MRVRRNKEEVSGREEKANYRRKGVKRKSHKIRCLYLNYNTDTFWSLAELHPVKRQGAQKQPSNTLFTLLPK